MPSKKMISNRTIQVPLRAMQSTEASSAKIITITSTITGQNKNNVRMLVSKQLLVISERNYFFLIYKYI